MQDENQLLTYEDASYLLNIPLGTLYCLVSRNQIPHCRPPYRNSQLVRFKREELLSWMRGAPELNSSPRQPKKTKSSRQSGNAL